MRLARVQVPEEPHPVVALERDGALYDVAELERALGLALDGGRLASASDFHARVVALRAAGLAELDEALAAGRRPTEARLVDPSPLYLPPCDVERAGFFWADPDHGGIRIGLGRVLAGDGLPAVLPEGSRSGAWVPAVGALLAEDARRPSEPEAASLIAGIAPLVDWRAFRVSAGSPPLEAGLAAHFGPTLALLGPAAPFPALPDGAPLRVRLREGEAIRWASAPDLLSRLAASIALVGRDVDLLAGDVVACPLSAELALPREVAPSLPVELTIERVGRLRASWARARG